MGCPESGGCPSLGTLRSGWMGSEHLVELWVSLLIARRLDQMVFKSPFPLKRFNDSMIMSMVEKAPAAPQGPAGFSKNPLQGKKQTLTNPAVNPCVAHSALDQLPHCTGGGDRVA